MTPAVSSDAAARQNGNVRVTWADLNCERNLASSSMAQSVSMAYGVPHRPASRAAYEVRISQSRVTTTRRSTRSRRRTALPSVPVARLRCRTRMLEMLALRDAMRVVAIGTGTGYNAALLCQRLGAEHVFSVDVDPELVASGANPAGRPRATSRPGREGRAARLAPARAVRPNPGDVLGAGDPVGLGRAAPRRRPVARRCEAFRRSGQIWPCSSGAARPCTAGSPAAGPGS
jgi:SAM-dependent methyltransferase